MSKDNMKIWDALGKTDPAHTKQFTRAGGFKGTAIKPMWANQQMTEFFGPCGIGWGPEEPRFNVVPAGEEIMVYCTVGLWYMHKNSADEWERGRVYGQGGDKVISQIFLKDSRGQKIIDEAKGGYKTYPQTDDEAFKKAYTDALSNAMKFIGVGADVHMGQFEDNKYVQEVRSEFEEAKKVEIFAEVERQKFNIGRSSPTTLADAAANADEATMLKAFPTIPPELDWSYNKASGVLICRVVDVKVAKTKGAKPKEYVAVKINQQIDGKDMAFYWHESHKAELLAAKGKICKFLTLFTDKGFLNIDMVTEIDGFPIVSKEPAQNNEYNARLLGSMLDFDDEDLREVHAHHGGDWAKVVVHLKDLKQRKDEGSAV